MDLSWLYEVPLWTVVLPVLLLVLLLPMEAGFRLGSRRTLATLDTDRHSRTDVTLAAMLTLLGLMLAFTYSFSMSRADLRKQALITEVNALSTAFLRADAAPEPERTELRLRLLEYARTRLVRREALSSWEQVEEATRKSLQAQSRIWPATKSVVVLEEGMSDPLNAVLVQSVNAVLDAHTMRMAVIYDRLPGVVMALLLLIAGSCMAVAA